MKGTVIILLALIGIVYFVENSLVKYFIIGILSLIVIMKATNYLVISISHYAYLTGIGDYAIGLLVVSLATTLPDLTTAIMSSVSKSGNLILGDVIGSNIIDITLVLGLVAIAGRSIVVEDTMVKKNLLITPLMIIAILLVAIDGVISRLDGLMLLIIFILYLVDFLRGLRNSGAVEKTVRFRQLWGDMVVFLGALVAILLSARWLVYSSIHISRLLEIDLFSIGLLFVALGMTLPEMMVGITSALKKKHHITFGNILGAMALNNSLVIGVGAVINPIALESVPEFIHSALFMLVAVLIGVYFLRKQRLTWHHGIVLIGIYAIFLFYQFLFV